VIQLSGLGHCEKSLRHPSFEAFIDHAKVESHGDRRGFVGSCIEKLAVNHDYDRNKARLALTGELNQSDGARSGIGGLASRLLDEFLGKESPGKKKEAGNCHCRRQDDAGHPVTI